MLFGYFGSMAEPEVLRACLSHPASLLSSNTVKIVIIVNCDFSLDNAVCKRALREQWNCADPFWAPL